MAGPIPDMPDRFRLTIPLRRPLATQGAFTAFMAVGGLVVLAFGKQALEARRGSAARPGALTPQARASLPARGFAIPSERKYPINDYRHGQLALTYVASPSNVAYRYRVMLKTFLRYPGLINWWGTTKVGREEPLSAALFRRKIAEYRRGLKRQSGAKRQQVEDEISALQALEKLAPRLRLMAQRAAA